MDNASCDQTRRLVGSDVPAWDVEECLRRWEAAKEGDTTEEYRAQSLSLARDMLAWLGVRHPCEVDLEAAERWMHRLATEGRYRNGKPRKLAGGTRNTYLLMLRSMWAYWVKHTDKTAIRKNPWEGVEKASKRTNPQRWLTQEEIERLVAVAERDEAAGDAGGTPRRTKADGSVVRRSLLYRFLAETGMRRQAAMGLRWSAFLLGADPPRCGLKADESKTELAQSFTLSDDLTPLLRAAKRGKSPDDLAFGVVRAEVLADDVREAGIPERDELGRRVGFNGFRRMGARARQAGVPLESVSELLGHSDVKTTARHYNEVTAEEKVRRANTLSVKGLRTGEVRSAQNIADSPVASKQANRYLVGQFRPTDTSHAGDSASTPRPELLGVLASPRTRFRKGPGYRPLRLNGRNRTRTCCADNSGSDGTLKRRVLEEVLRLSGDLWPDSFRRPGREPSDAGVKRTTERPDERAGVRSGPVPDSGHSPARATSDRGEPEGGVLARIGPGGRC